MAVRRVVANLAIGASGEGSEAARAFYEGVLGMEPVMDLGWIVTFAAQEQTRSQVSLATQGGAGTAVPALSVEVDDLDAVLARAQVAGIGIEYGPVTEDWGVRRFYMRDPGGRLINVLTHV